MSNTRNITIRKPEDKGGYINIYKRHISLNRKLSADEKEMLMVLLSFDDFHEFDSDDEQVCKKEIYYYCSKKDERTLDKIYNNLKKKGHLKLTKKVDEQGKFRWEYEVWQQPLPEEERVPTFVIAYTRQAKEVVVKKKMADVEAIAAQYGIPLEAAEAFIKALAGGGGGGGGQSETPKPTPNPKAEVAQEKTKGFFQTLKADTAAHNEAVNKWELKEGELQKHLENFETAKTAHHTDYAEYSKHFVAYVGKTLEAVRKVVSKRAQAQEKPKKEKPPKQAQEVKTAINVSTLKDDEVFEKAREHWQGTDIKLPFNEFRNNVDLFLMYANEAQRRSIENPNLKKVADPLRELRRKPGALRQFYDQENGAGVEKTLQGLKDIFGNQTGGKSPPPKPPPKE
jgi:hypothetical protein